MVINVSKKDIVAGIATVDEYVLPPNVTKNYIKAPRSAQKHPSKETMMGKWKGCTPPPMPRK